VIPKESAKGRGRPNKRSKSKANPLKIANKSNSKHQLKARRSNRQFSLKKVENPDFWKTLPKPPHNGHEISQDQIDSAIRIIYTLKEKNMKDVFKLVSEGLDIHVNTLYKIWRDFIK
jgi:hypothetical protein